MKNIVAFFLLLQRNNLLDLASSVSTNPYDEKAIDGEIDSLHVVYGRYVHQGVRAKNV